MGSLRTTIRARNSLTYFKRHNGFQRIKVPRYFVPLTAWGRIGLKLGLHHRIRDRLPPRIPAKTHQLPRQVLSLEVVEIRSNPIAEFVDQELVESLVIAVNIRLRAIEA